MKLETTSHLVDFAGIVERATILFETVLDPTRLNPSKLISFHEFIGPQMPINNEFLSENVRECAKACKIFKVYTVRCSTGETVCLLVVRFFLPNS